MPFHRRTLVCLFLSCARLVTAQTDVVTTHARTTPVFSLYFENDVFANQDGNYTSGVKFAWLSADLTSWGQAGWRKTFLEALPFVNRPGGQKNLGFALGQNFYTPQDTGRVNPDPTDRPYAGWTYAELSFVSKTEHVMDSLALQAGMVGRHSYAQDTQTSVHRLIGSRRPRGWAYQVKDEVGVNIVYERKWRLYGRSFGEMLGVDFIPHAGASLGNVAAYANLGGTARLGLQLPNDFGVSLIGPTGVTNAPIDDADPRIAQNKSWSLFVFGGVDGRAVARDIFLDGNTFRDSRSVNKEPFVADLGYGVGAVLGRWQVTYTQVQRSKAFKGQVESNFFGSITVSRTF